MAGTDQAPPRPRALDDLPAEVLDRIIAHLPPHDLASLNATARLFHDAPPGERSPVERALRERARARGHDRALPPTLPAHVSTWTAELLARERVLELACAHASPVAAGYSISAFVDAEGGLHTCGEEEVGARYGEPTGEYRPHLASSHQGVEGALVPMRAISLSAVRVRSVAASYHHLLALSDAGAVYGCGDNTFGQLGLGDKDERRSFALVDALREEPAVCIAAGGGHSLALTAAGCVYSWGCNGLGQLGHGDRKERWEPTRIEALDGVWVGGVAAGHEHTLLLSTSGAVYSCGHGRRGRLGHGDEQHQHTPRRIEALAGVRAVHVSAGHGHSLVVDSDGAVYSFGSGGHAELGHGGRCYRDAPTRIEALAGARAVRASAGFDSSAVLGADGSVHTFGLNVYGPLGHPGSGKLQLPMRVHALAHARVTRCSLGVAHALYVTADGAVYSCGQQSAALGQGVSMAAAWPGAAEGGARTLRTPTRIEQAPRLRLHGGLGSA